MNLPYAVLDYAIANAEGAPRNRALMLGVVGGTLKSPLLGVLLAAMLGRQQQAAQAANANIGPLFGRRNRLFGRAPAAAWLAPPAAPQPAAAPAVAAAAAPPPPMIGFVPNFQGLSRAQADELAGHCHLVLRHRGDDGGRISEHEPAFGSPVPRDRTVKLVWAK